MKEIVSEDPTNKVVKFFIAIDKSLLFWVEEVLYYVADAGVGAGGEADEADDEDCAIL